LPSCASVQFGFQLVKTVLFECFKRKRRNDHPASALLHL
jgi:hypothetical protein